MKSLPKPSIVFVSMLAYKERQNQFAPIKNGHFLSTKKLYFRNLLSRLSCTKKEASGQQIQSSLKDKFICYKKMQPSVFFIRKMEKRN